nr:phosphoribosylaminoimidazolesuccinocarboxamide synthase [Actinopolyspora biskrensis]
MQIEQHRSPSISGRSKKLWHVDEETCFVRLVESLTSYTHERHELVSGTGPLRLDFYEMAASRLREEGIPCAFLRRVDQTGYLAKYYKVSPPVEVIVKNRAVGSTLRKYPGLFAEEEVLPRPVVKFDYRCDPEDQPIGEDYLRALGIPVEKMYKTALTVNELLCEWLDPIQLWDFCLIFGIDSEGDPSIISEVSPDCMRLRAEDGSMLDKDIFRNGGEHTEITTAWKELIEHVS